MGLLEYFGFGQVEDRNLAPPSDPPHLPLSLGGPVVNVTTGNALRLSDAYACVRALSDGVASLPLHAYRRTPAGRVPVGEEARISQLLARPSPGSTLSDLIGQIVVHLNIHGECFVGKYRAEGEIVQLGLIDPTTVGVELRGQRIVYTLADRTEHGPADVLHIKSMSSDGLRGLSPVTAARTALALGASLQGSAQASAANGGRPSGLLKVPAPQSDATVEEVRERWDARHGGSGNAGRIAVVQGDVSFDPVSFSATDAQFIQQRELSTREIARIFRVPSWIIGGGSGDSMTYANVSEQARAFVTFSLRPWLVRLERAISNDADLCPGGTYVEFALDGLLRSDAAARSAVYTAALNPQTGWLTRQEVRALEDLPPEQPEPENTNQVGPALDPLTRPEKESTDA